MTDVEAADVLRTIAARLLSGEWRLTNGEAAIERAIELLEEQDDA